MFGKGIYFGDNSGKIDQFCDIDKEYNTGSLLHQRLYPDEGNCRPTSFGLIIHSGPEHFA
ncbi:hypothetical protein T484DRAFT_1767807 [Baffinella frigidus]|nr:hypothetical protein T484DRAFT_1767807 [Cryptophyta sp. CCMP2293]